MGEGPRVAVRDAGTVTGKYQVGRLTCVVDMVGIRKSGRAREYT